MTDVSEQSKLILPPGVNLGRPLRGLDLLRAPFPPNQISKLPKPLSKNAPKGNCQECGGYHGLPAIHLDYVGHAALTLRLLEVDPEWNWEPLSTDASGLPAFDKNGGLWIKLTVCGVTRLGYGDATNRTGGDAIKEAIGDALRNAAMRFGAALDLWHKGELYADPEDAQDPQPPQKKRQGKKPAEQQQSAQQPTDQTGGERRNAAATVDEGKRKLHEQVKGTLADFEAKFLECTTMDELSDAFIKGQAAIKKHLKLLGAEIIGPMVTKLAAAKDARKQALEAAGNTE